MWITETETVLDLTTCRKWLVTRLSEVVTYDDSLSLPVYGLNSMQSMGKMRRRKFNSPAWTSSELSHPGSEPLQLGDDSGVPELPRCDELERWLSVIPPHVLDRLFDYLEAFNDNDTQYSSARKPSQKRHSGQFANTQRLYQLCRIYNSATTTLCALEMAL